MMKHMYYLSDEELLRRWPGLRSGSIDPALISREKRRYSDQVGESVAADVVVLGPEHGPQECVKDDHTAWGPREFAKQLWLHLQSLSRPRKRTRRAVVDSDSESPMRGHALVDNEAEESGGESGEESGGEESDEADEHGNLRGFVVPDSASSASGASPGASDVTSPGVSIVGERSRAQRDADGRANAVDLTTPPHM